MSNEPTDERRRQNAQNQETPNKDLRDNAGIGAGVDPVEDPDPDDVNRTPGEDKRVADGHASADDEVTVDPEDLTVTRDGDAQLEAEPIEAGSLGTLKVYPMTYGDVNSLFGDGQQMDVGPAKMADIFKRFIAEPDLDTAAREAGYTNGLGEEYVKDMKPLVPRDLLVAVMEVSGIDIDEMQMDPEETRAQMSVSGN